jgi:hypothetical protein
MPPFELFGDQQDGQFVTLFGVMDALSVLSQKARISEPTGDDISANLMARRATALCDQHHFIPEIPSLQSLIRIRLRSEA